MAIIGFPAVPKDTGCAQPWGVVFKQATEIILNVLQGYNQFETIRDAARFSFARLINCIGAELLPLLPAFITGLLTECQISELVDFLPFIGMISFKFKVKKEKGKDVDIIVHTYLTYVFFSYI